MFIFLLQSWVDRYFDRMGAFSNNPALPIRIRFMLRDIIEMRKAKWVPRKAISTEGPLPITQVCIVYNIISSKWKTICQYNLTYFYLFDTGRRWRSNPACSTEGAFTATRTFQEDPPWVWQRTFQQPFFCPNW
jgi:hypothetical protein